MKAIPSRLFAISSAVGICLLGQSVFASPVTLVQNYGFLNGFAVNDQFLNTLLTISVKYDEGSLGGAGDESIAAESIDLLFSDRGLTGLPTGLTATNAVGNAGGDFIPVSGFTALYFDGVFQSFSSNSGIGILSEFVQLDGVNVFNSIRLSAGGGTLIEQTPNGRIANFKLINSAITPDIAVIPLPAALPLFASGFALLGLLGWRRKRVIAA